ncbi:TetR family transcriptional regulator C-terminal domain-containing protein [Phenylobacterium sp.]|uniref:TetR family transcriptional regulator C-terminal domain-containing protein n=1 Tax=Phenylobacterium sp. TaxID=1871053 RepID=UPI002EDB40D7
MTTPASTPPRSFQRTIAAWTGPSAGRAAGAAPPSSHRVTFRARSVEFGAVVLEADFEDAWRGGVRELGAGALGALLDAAFEAAAQTVTHEPLHALSLDEVWRLTGCPLKALSADLDDRPGPARDLLKARLAEFRTAVAAEVRRLRDPPLTEDEARTAYFELRSYFLGYSDARRMMGDESAQQHLVASLEALLDRAAGAALAAPGRARI